MRIWQVIVFRLRFLSSYLRLELCGHWSFFFLSFILTWVFTCLVSSVIFSVSLKFNDLWSYTCVGSFELLVSTSGLLWWWDTDLTSSQDHFLQFLLFFCASPVYLVIFFWNIYPTYIVMVPKLVYILSSPGELLKLPKFQVTLSLIKSHSLQEGKQTLEAVRAPRWLWCADNFGNHRCVGFLDLFSMTLFFPSLFLGVLLCAPNERFKNAQRPCQPEFLSICSPDQVIL